MQKKILIASLVGATISLGIASAVSAQTFGTPSPITGSQPQTAAAPATAAQPNADNVYYNPIIDPVERNIQLKQSAGQKKIYMFYRNFKIETTPSGRVMCNLRLSVLTTIPEGINTLNFRLVWPEMVTGLGFYNVAPFQETFHDISLLGDGCYSLDRTPNVVVNTCRIKGMSAAECAQALVWSKPAKP